MATPEARQLLSLQRTAGNRAVVGMLGGGPRVQRYVEQDYTFSTWRQSEDLSLATKTGHSNHELYAQTALIGPANAALRAVNSGVELKGTGETDTFRNGSYWSPTKQATLEKVVAKNRQNNTEGDHMRLWADCGKANAVVVGGSDRVAVNSAPDGSGGTVTQKGRFSDPTMMKSQIMGGWLTRERAKNVGPTGDATVLAAIDVCLTAADAKVTELEAALQDLNDAATPEEARTAETRVKLKKTEAHSADRVVLENYAVGDPAVQNEAWTFEMYGTKKAQSFHEKHQATAQHGQSPTTMTVEKK